MPFGCKRSDMNHPQYNDLLIYFAFKSTNGRRQRCFSWKAIPEYRTSIEEQFLAIFGVFFGIFKSVAVFRRL